MTPTSLPLIVGIGGTLNPTSLSLFALKAALEGASGAGARTALLDLAALRLPMFEPRQKLERQTPEVQHFVHVAGEADGFVWSTGVYHGTVAGVMKNALDYLEFLRGSGRYLMAKPVGLIAVGGSEAGGSDAINSMVHTAHALHALTVPERVSVPRGRNVIKPHEGYLDEPWRTRLHGLGSRVVEMAQNQHLLQEMTRQAAAVGA